MKRRDDHPCFSGLTDVGGREHNEDSYLTATKDNAVLLAVADGLGGHAAGEVASAIAVEVVNEVFMAGYSEGMDTENIKSLLRTAHETAHRRVCDMATGMRKGMGTTLVTALISGDHVIIANTGDSRAYIIGESVLFRTRDHSVVESLVENGVIDEATARKHPLRHIITHTLGGDLAVDLYEPEMPEGSLLLLSSDGFHDYVETDVLTEGARMTDCKGIAGFFLEEGVRHSTDNVTVVVFRQ